MENIITINTNDRTVTMNKNTLGAQYENKIEYLVFELSEMIEGQGTLEIEKYSKEGKIEKYYLPLEYKDEKYYFEIKNSLLDVSKDIKMQLHITTEDGGAFRSEIFTMKVLDSVDTSRAIEEEYTQVIDQANQQILYIEQFKKDVLAGLFDGKDGEKGEKRRKWKSRIYAN